MCHPITVLFQNEIPESIIPSVGKITTFLQSSFDLYSYACVLLYSITLIRQSNYTYNPLSIYQINALLLFDMPINQAANITYV